MTDSAVSSRLVPVEAINVAPVGDIRRYNVISFDVLAFPFQGLLVTFQHGPATELAYAGGAWLAPYTESRAFPIEGGLRFQVKRSDGWKQPPGLVVQSFLPPARDPVPDVGDK